MTKDEAVAWARNQSALARKLGISRMAVSRWTEVPPLQQYRLAVLSEGKLTVHDPSISHPQTNTDTFTATLE